MAITVSANGVSGSNTAAHEVRIQSSDVHSGFEERGHQLEKLQFALAIALMRGNGERSQVLKHQIAELGGNAEEPGT